MLSTPLRAILAIVALTFTAHAVAQCVDLPPMGSTGDRETGTASCVRSSIEGDRGVTDYDLAVPAPGNVHDLTLDAVGATALEVCVYVGRERICRSSDADAVTYAGLRLEGQRLMVRVVLRGAPGQAFRVALTDRGPPQPGVAYEPNDMIGSASPLGDDLTIRGVFDGRDTDVLRVDLVGEPQLWRVQVLGASVDRLELRSASDQVLQRRDAEAGERGIRMSNLYLLPGPHFFAVRGTDGEYALRMIPLGPADEPPPGAAAAPGRSEPPAAGGAAPATPPGAAAAGVPVPRGPRPEGRMEREPNDTERTAQLLVPGLPSVGLLAEAGDVDVYRFYLGEDGPLRITVTPTDELAFGVRFGGGSLDRPPAGAPYVLERWFLAGDHHVALSAITASDGYYQIRLDRLDPFDLPDLLHPYGETWQARPLPSDHELRGVFEGPLYVQLPVSNAPTTLQIAVLEGSEGTVVQRLVTPDGSRVAAAEGRRGSGAFTLDVPAGGPYVVYVTGVVGEAIHLRFEFDAAGPQPIARPAAPALDMALVGPGGVAAYHPATQRFALELTLTNRGDAPLDLTLDTHVTDYGWRVEPRQRSLRVPAGGTVVTPLDATVSPRARDDLPIDVTVAARAADGALATTTLSLAAVCGLPPNGAVHAWPIPTPLLGGVNVAWTNLGSEVQGTLLRDLAIYDGLTPPGYGWSGGIGAATTVRLAGEGTPRLLGVLLHPLSDSSVDHRLADFRVLASLDGVTFTPVFEGRMRTVPEEQGFVFDAPVAARYVRLEALSNHGGDPGRPTGLGQFKVIAEPGARVLGDRVDLGRREHGGHVAAALPFVASYELTSATPTSVPPTVRLEADQPRLWWVQAFHHNRAALIDGLEWIPHAGEEQGRSSQRLERVTVSVSIDGPLGPWTELGPWEPYAQPQWTFAEPVWARFVRFESSDYGDSRPTLPLPDRVAIYEHPEGERYRSVLGEWGHYARDAVYEWRFPPTFAASARGGDNASRETALLLAPGGTAVSRVLVSEYDAWFAFDVPPGSNFVRLELRGDPTIDYRYRFIDERGAEVVADVVESAERATLEAFLPPGRYYLHAWEPLRNVVFSWDDSGSMGPYIEPTYQTVFGFARAVDPSRERVQLQVFSGPPYFLMDDWSSDPVEVLRAVLAYPRDDGSSDAELNLAFVVSELAKREGTRAVLLVTDAESGPSSNNVTPLWQAFMAAPVKVFAFETSTAGSDDTQDRMQTWADVGGGFYDFSRSLGDLDVAFARASCLLRQPKAVRVGFEAERREPPGPGALAVRRPARTDAEREAARPAVHVIYDASGSMGQLIRDGSASRLQVARRVLTELVDEVIEAGTPFALRAYGHVAPMSCDTALAHPLAPLDPRAARAAIASVEPKLLSRTPLAASIAAVAQDLRTSTGPKTVILLTDGEETCDGTPEAAIRDLLAQVSDVTLSIVGFDVETSDAAAMRANFAAWAALGGGIFLEAFDARGLREALETALRAEVELAFEVLDADGQVVAGGVVDAEPVSLPAGRYTVRIVGVGGQGQVIEGISVRHETATSVTLEGE
jgi:hypothetical protein